MNQRPLFMISQFNIEPPGFTEFWRLWPAHERKVGKANCIAIWHKQKLEKIADKVLAALELSKKSSDWKRGFVPRPQSWLNLTPWLSAPEEISPPSRADQESLRIDRERAARAAEKKRWEEEMGK